MKLYFLRHGIADWPNWSKPDDERPLTNKGIREMERVAKFLASRRIKPGRILSSPLVRAMQTAEITSKALGIKVEVERRLSPGFDREALEMIIESYPGEDLMLVGHEPGLSATIRDITGGEIKMGKSCLARIDYLPELGMGLLVWLLPARITAD